MRGSTQSARCRGRHVVLPAWSLAFAAAASLAGLLLCDPARSADATVSVSPTITAQPATHAPFTIKVGPEGALPRNSFVRIRGLPPMAGVSNGHSIAPGAWAIPLAALPSLQIMVPAGASGRAEVSITLVSIDGTVLAQTKTTLIVVQADKVVTAEKAAAPQKPATARAPGPPPTPPAATASILRTAPIPPGATSPEAKAPESLSAASTPEDRERALRLMKKGDDQMQEGNIAGARLFYERAADAGLAQAAMALAATYDASELSHVSRRGIQPDPTQARRWYERAKQLGAAEAAARLQRLGNN